MLCYCQELNPQLRSQEAQEGVLSTDYLIKHKEPFIPNLIVQTRAGEKSLLFFLDRPMNVFFIEHSPKHLDSMTDKHSTIVWEQDGKDTPVEYHMMLARIIATASTDLRIIHEFQKNARRFYMPCPSELQIRLMGLIYRKYAMEQDIITDTEIHRRVEKYGPFIRNALCWSDLDFQTYELARNKEINKACATDKSLCEVLASPLHIMESDRYSVACSPMFSHRLARYVVDRDNAISCDTNAYIAYQFSSDEVMNIFSLEISKLSIELVKKHLMSVKRYSTCNGFTPEFLE